MDQQPMRFSISPYSRMDLVRFFIIVFFILNSSNNQIGLFDGQEMPVNVFFHFLPWTPLAVLSVGVL